MRLYDWPIRYGGRHKGPTCIVIRGALDVITEAIRSFATATDENPNCCHRKDSRTSNETILSSGASSAAHSTFRVRNRSTTCIQPYAGLIPTTEWYKLTGRTRVVCQPKGGCRGWISLRMFWGQRNDVRCNRSTAPLRTARPLPVRAGAQLAGPRRYVR